MKERDTAVRILDSALMLAEARGWEAVRLAEVAAAAGVTLAELAHHYREKEALAEAWFDRADRALFAAAAEPAFATLTARARIEQLILAWLGALAAHRRVTRQMILNKLEPGHLHVQIPALLRISRTVQWIREAAGREARFLHRALEEAALSTIFVTTFCRWLDDDSPDSADTRRLLVRLLSMGESCESLCARAPYPATHIHA